MPQNEPALNTQLGGDHMYMQSAATKLDNAHQATPRPSQPELLCVYRKVTRRWKNLQELSDRLAVIQSNMQSNVGRRN